MWWCDQTFGELVINFLIASPTGSGYSPHTGIFMGPGTSRKTRDLTLDISF